MKERKLSNLNSKCQITQGNRLYAGVGLDSLFVSFFGGFHSYGVVTITGEGLQILTYAQLSWPEGFLACRAYCDTGHPFIMVISEDP